MLWRERTSCRVLSASVSEKPLRPSLGSDQGSRCSWSISGALSKASLARTHCDPKGSFLLGQMKTGHPLLLGCSTGLQGPQVGNGDQY